MGYCFMTIEKIHTRSEMAGKFGHNYRTYDVPNADRTLSHLNDEILSMHGKDYLQCFDESLKEHNISKVRKGGILGLEVLMVLPKTDMERVDIEKWKQDNLKWLQDTFNVGGRQNVKSAVFHADEAGSVHIHALVIPIDERGRLNASRFVDGGDKMRHMQNTYGTLMGHEHGLKRGLEGSKAKHQDIKKYYTALNQAVRSTLDKPHEKETLDEYYKRANAQYQSLNMQKLAEQEKMQRKIDETRTLSEQKRRALSKENRELHKQAKNVSETLHVSLNNQDELKRLEYNARGMKLLKDSLKNHPDSAKMAELKEDIQTAINWSIEQQKMKRDDQKHSEKLREQPHFEMEER